MTLLRNAAAFLAVLAFLAVVLTWAEYAETYTSGWAS